MVALVIFVCFLFAAAFLVEIIGSDIMHVYKLGIGLLSHLTIPFAVGIIAALYLAVFPSVARSERHYYRSGPLLSHILNKLSQIPAKGVDEFITARVFHLVYMGGIRCTGYHSPHSLRVYGTNIIMSELQQHIVAGLQ